METKNEYKVGTKPLHQTDIYTIVMGHADHQSFSYLEGISMVDQLNSMGVMEQSYHDSAQLKRVVTLMMNQLKDIRRIVKNAKKDILPNNTSLVELVLDPETQQPVLLQTQKALGKEINYLLLDEQANYHIVNEPEYSALKVAIKGKKVFPPIVEYPQVKQEQPKKFTGFVKGL